MRATDDKRQIGPVAGKKLMAGLGSEMANFGQSTSHQGFLASPRKGNQIKFTNRSRQAKVSQPLEGCSQVFHGRRGDRLNTDEADRFSTRRDRKQAACDTAESIEAVGICGQADCGGDFGTE